MDESKDYHTKWSKSGTERQISYNLYVESKKKKIQTDIFTKINGLPNIESKLIVTKGERGGEG